MKRPSFQFYPGDWLNDVGLRMCSLGARGLWVDMMAYMHQANPYGHLMVNGKVILPSNLARMCGTTLPEIEGYLAELRDAGVYSEREDGCIYSRRMVRDEEIRKARAEGGKKGGNPALLKGKDISEVSEKVENKVNLQDNLQPTPSSSSSSSSSKLKDSRALRADARLILEYLNQEAGKKFEPVDANLDLIVGRLKQGATIEQCRAVIDGRVALWLRDPKMAQYLRPATIFAAKNYAQYVGELGAAAVSAVNGRPWWETASGIAEKGKELGLSQEANENFVYFKNRVYRAAGKPELIDGHRQQ